MFLFTIDALIKMILLFFDVRYSFAGYFVSLWYIYYYYFVSHKQNLLHFIKITTSNVNVASVAAVL